MFSLREQYVNDLVACSLTFDLNTLAETVPKLATTLRRLTLKLFSLEREHSRMVSQGTLKLPLRGTRVWRPVGLQSSKHKPEAANTVIQLADREECFICHTLDRSYQQQFGPLMRKFVARFIDCPLLFTPKKRPHTSGLLLNETQFFTKIAKALH